MIRLDELDHRAWAGAIVDDYPQDVDEPCRAIQASPKPRKPFRWPFCAELRLARLKGVNR